ncbi:MAG: ATP-binding protein [Treponema sp.]|nr:ATP-binding protein [Treponema sp.]MDY4985515.1 ATP-binding protein [Treponema sp.]
MNSKNNDAGNLNNIRKQIQGTQLFLIISVTILLSLGGALININSNNKLFNQNLQNTAELITRLYSFTSSYTQSELQDYMDSVVADLPDVDVVSIVDTNNIRLYHTNHELMNTKYDGTLPDFNKHNSNYYTESSIGPSGPQRRTYSAIYDDDGIYRGFIMTIRLQVSITMVTEKIIIMFLLVILASIFIEVSICRVLSIKIKREFLAFTEDFEGTKFLVDSMRANNHDFTNKLHVILGLIQIGQYEKAVSYIENISIIQRETISKVMNSIENPSLAALVVGKIARASECNVRFTIKEGTSYKNDDITVPSEALVTITGNLIDNALDAMNMDSSNTDKELQFGAYTKDGELLIIVKDTGPGIPKENLEKIFENGFSTKGTGRGIGLYHTKQLIESLGGKITVESQTGRGSCFMVILYR